MKTPGRSFSRKNDSPLTSVFLMPPVRGVLTVPRGQGHSQNEPSGLLPLLRTSVSIKATLHVLKKREKNGSKERQMSLQWSTPLICMMARPRKETQRGTVTHSDVIHKAQRELPAISFFRS